MTTWRAMWMACWIVALVATTARAEDLGPPEADAPLEAVAPDLTPADLAGPLFPTGVLRMGWEVTEPAVVGMHPVRFRELAALAMKAERLETKWRAAVDDLAAERRKPPPPRPATVTPWWKSPVTWGLVGAVGGALATAWAMSES